MAVDLTEFEPVAIDYQETHQSEIITFSLGGGLSKQRVDFLGKPRLLDVTWQMPKYSYDNFMAKIYEYRDGGSLLYSVKVTGEFGTPVATDCRIVSDLTVTWEGNTCRIRATLEAVHYAD